MKDDKRRESKKEKLRESALEYHRAYPCGKLGIHATKPMANQADLALALFARRGVRL